MHHVDKLALRALENLRQKFEVQETMSLPPLPAGEGVLIGFEVEVPWRAYFPEL